MNRIFLALAMLTISASIFALDGDGLPLCGLDEGGIAPSWREIGLKVAVHAVECVQNANEAVHTARLLLECGHFELAKKVVMCGVDSGSKSPEHANSLLDFVHQACLKGDKDVNASEDTSLTWAEIGLKTAVFAFLCVETALDAYETAQLLKKYGYLDLAKQAVICGLNYKNNSFEHTNRLLNLVHEYGLKEEAQQNPH